MTSSQWGIKITTHLVTRILVYCILISFQMFMLWDEYKKRIVFYRRENCVLRLGKTVKAKFIWGIKNI